MNKTLSNIDRKVAKLKKETSENPRKELANRGVEWSADSYYEALQNKDTETALLFIEGGQALKLKWSPEFGQENKVESAEQ